MEFMHWGPRDLGYRAATPDHIEAVIELMNVRQRAITAANARRR